MEYKYNKSEYVNANGGLLFPCFLEHIMLMEFLQNGDKLPFNLSSDVDEVTVHG